MAPGRANAKTALRAGDPSTEFTLSEVEWARDDRDVNLPWGVLPSRSTALMMFPGRDWGQVHLYESATGASISSLASRPATVSEAARLSWR
jgi:hypothetical protein